MIKYLILLLFIINHAWSADRLELSLNETEVNQGALVHGKLFLESGSLNLPLQKLKGNTIGETLYFHQVTPLLKKSNASSYESEVQVIFIKVPESENIPGTLGQQDILIHIGALKVKPVEAPGQMLWADFSAPDFMVGTWKWVWITLIIILLTVLSFFIWKKFSTKRRARLLRVKLIENFRKCRNYEEVVDLWKNKRTYLREFPLLEDKFRDFEVVLFRYQFKPSQSETEKEAVMEAYRKLLSESEGGLRGV